MNKYPLLRPDFPHLLHGADYNPDQWLDAPDIWNEDFRLMRLAGCNVMSVGIFAWSALEPEEGRFEFSWLDSAMDRLAENGMYAVLATPSGARPAWLAQKYPEVLRVAADRRRLLYGERHNHCYTSPVYRQKAREISTLLARRYGKHPALLGWHVSNEYGGECHCPLCQEAFREFLKERYRNLDALNRAWWTSFWSHRYTDWSQIESPSPIGETSLHGLALDWKRFVVQATIGFFENEAAPLREWAPGVPITTNFVTLAGDIDQFKFARHLDFASWDSYPLWHNTAEKTWQTAARTGFLHDLCRGVKGGRPFALMESTPSAVNWAAENKLKRPGMHLLSSLQAVAHGADSVQYFQWRAGRGGAEKFHGAVVGHAGHEHTRVFGDVAQVGRALRSLDGVAGCGVSTEAALLFDWENRWAVGEARALSPGKTDYEGTCIRHYEPFWRRGIPLRILDEDGVLSGGLSGCRLLAAPMLYMVRPGVAQALERFVRAGGTLVLTYWSGIAGESDLCFLGGFPGPLRGLAGVWAEEIDVLSEGEAASLHFLPAEAGAFPAEGRFCVQGLWEHVHLQGARALAEFDGGFFGGMPAVTENVCGAGRVYYIAARTGGDFLGAFYEAVANRLGLRRMLERPLPEGVSAQARTDGENEFLFLMNFSEEEKRVELGGAYPELLSGGEAGPELALPPYGVRVVRRPAPKRAVADSALENRPPIE